MGYQSPCHEECLGNIRLVAVVLTSQEIQKQLISYCQRNNISVNPAERPDKDSILKAFLSGYIMNTAVLQMDGSYRTCFSHHVCFHMLCP